jgi:hypothetical protein
MPNYRRAFIPGGCFFFTVNLLERRQTMLVDAIGSLREAVATTRRGGDRGAAQPSVSRAAVCGPKAADYAHQARAWRGPDRLQSALRATSDEYEQCPRLPGDDPAQELPSQDGPKFDLAYLGREV